MNGLYIFKKIDLINDKYFNNYFMPELYINDDSINNLDNCDYLSILNLRIFVHKNINLLLDKLYKFTNLEILILYDNKITEIHGLDNLVNLQQLNLYNNQITEIKELHIFASLQVLHLHENYITEIKGLDNLVNLDELRLCHNQITEIKGLDNLVNLQKIYLSYNQITEIKGLKNLVNLQILKLSYNKITEIKGLDNLVNLQSLNLSYNKITEIKGLNTLASLKELNLSYNQIKEIKGLNTLASLKELNLSYNKIKEIKGLNTLASLQKLVLCCNQIKEIKGLNTLASLQILILSNNEITEIKKLYNLSNLRMLNLKNNKIKELPLFLCNLKNINYISYSNNPIEYIPLPVQRLLDRINNGITINNMIYTDKQNIHNHHIQNSFQASLNNIFKDTQLLDLITIKQQILENNILTEQTKREILNYCDDDVMHTSLLITYSDLLIYVWSRITFNPNKDEILQVLNQEISDGLCMCFTGRLTRLLNTLVGFYDDIELQISDSEQITNIIMALKDKFLDKEQLRDVVKKELLDRQYSEIIINEWLDYI